MLCCDLHTHSAHSDGTVSPSELVRLAAGKKLAAIALTDHDTLSGLDEAVEAGHHDGVRVLSGIELSVEYCGRTVHMLGYCFDRGAAKLQDQLDSLVRDRTQRNLKMITLLSQLG